MHTNKNKKNEWVNEDHLKIGTKGILPYFTGLCILSMCYWSNSTRMYNCNSVKLKDNNQGFKSEEHCWIIKVTAYW